MQTMTDFIKNKPTALRWQGETPTLKTEEKAKPKIVTEPKLEPQKPDTFEKSAKTEEKGIKKYYKAGAAAVGALAVAVVGFVNRKNIARGYNSLKETVTDFVSNKLKRAKPSAPKTGVEPPISSQPLKNPETIAPTMPVQPKVIMTVNELADEISKTEIKDIPKIVEGIANGTKEEQENLLKVYLKLKRKYYKLPKDDIGRDDLGSKFFMVEEQMIDKNISFIPDVKIKPSDIANEKKLVWKLEKTTQNMPKNEASLFAGLEWIEKNGEYFNGIDFSKHMSMVNTMLDLITVHLREDIAKRSDVTDKVLNKYLDVFEKYAKRWEKYGFLRGDATNLEILFEENARKLSKETAFRFLDVFERKATTNNQSHSFILNLERLNIDEESRAEMLRRLEILDKKLPRFEKKK